MAGMRLVVIVVLLAAGAAIFHAPAAAGVIALTSGDSQVEIDPSSAAGVFNWQIGGVSHLSQQWFWFRASLDGLDDREYSLHLLDDSPVIFQHPAMPNIARLTYSDDRLEVEVTYVLVSGTGLRTADLLEVIKITNLTDDRITLNFFQYTDFDLGGDDEDDHVRIIGGNTVFQQDIDSNITLSETIVSRNPDRHEVAAGSDILDKLEDDNIDDLSGPSLLAIAGDLTWAFQWKDREIPAGQALLISKDKVLTSRPIAEPAALCLIGLALLARPKRRT